MSMEMPDGVAYGYRYDDGHTCLHSSKLCATTNNRHRDRVPSYPAAMVRAFFTVYPKGTDEFRPCGKCLRADRPTGR